MTLRMTMLATMLSLIALNAKAAGYTNWSTPTMLEVVNNGVLIGGDFGDLNSCGQADYIFYPSSHQQYDVVVSVVLAAIAGGREVRFYTGSCTSVSFHWAGNVINLSWNGSGIYTR